MIRQFGGVITTQGKTITVTGPQTLQGQEVVVSVIFPPLPFS